MSENFLYSNQEMVEEEKGGMLKISQDNRN